MVEIVRDDEIRAGDPRIAGTRITVLDVKRRVVGAGEDPFAIAAEYDLDPAAVFAALSFYYDNAEEMRTLEDRHEALTEDIRRQSAAIRDNRS